MKVALLASLITVTLLGQTKVDYPTQVKNGPVVVDTAYASLQLGCDAAATQHASLNVTKVWLAVPTTTCNAVVNFIGTSASIQPAASAIFTMDGYTAVDRRQVWDVSLSGFVRLSSGAAGTAIFAGNFGPSGGVGFAGACNTAAAANITGGSLVLVNSPVAITSDTSCAANLQAISGGSFTMTNAALTLTGSFDGDLTQHFDLSAGGRATVILSGATTGRPVEWWGAKADFVLPSTVTTDSCLPIGYALLQGGTVQLAKGYYYSSCAIATTLPSTTIFGMGNGDTTCVTAATCLIFAAGVGGFTSGASSGEWTIKGLTLFSLSVGASAGKHGISPGTGPVYLDRVTVVGFPADGFHADTVNVDHSNFKDTFFYGNFGNGWYCNSGDCNSITSVNMRTWNNGGIGFDLVDGITSTYIDNDSQSNTGIEYYIGGVSNVFLAPYCEASGPMTIAGVWNTVLLNKNGVCTVTNTGGASNQIQQGFRVGNPGGGGMYFLPNSSGGVVQGVDSSNNILNTCGVGDATDPCGIDGPFYTTNTATNLRSSNYIATETGANNAIAGALTHGPSNAAVPLTDGLRVTVSLAHTLGTGAGNTFNLNGGGALAIGSHNNPPGGLTTGYALNGKIDLMYSNANGVWVDMSQ